MSPPESTPSPDPLSLFDYRLPPELIAQSPPAVRGTSRLLAIDRAAKRWEHSSFQEITRFIRPGDLMVLNDTRVFPARLRALLPTGRKVEVLLLEPRNGGPAWLALGRPARALKPGKTAALEPEGVTVHPLGREDDKVIVELRRGEAVLDPPEVFQVCERAGETPLPPYIHREEGDRRSPLDRERYQTVYARQLGAVAAPTAGLHFTEEILRAVRDAGAALASVTLHVGHGTFKPLTEEAYARSSLHPEWVSVEEEAGRKILLAREAGRRVISVGTTTLRAIESFLSAGRLPFRGNTDIFIKPGYTFRGVDALITNFHLPRSSLLCLVSAFAGRELILRAYEAAIREGYRFYSYGDAMLIS